MKPRETILSSDPRFGAMAGGYDAMGCVRRMEITDLYDHMEEIQLQDAVPAGIAEQFDKAKHAYLYSWFAYDLASLAEQQGYQTLELAFREKLTGGERERAERQHWGLGRLFSCAIAHRWLDPREFVDPDTKLNLLDSLVRSRNELAHGSTNLFPVGSIAMLDLCAEILNKLFCVTGPGRHDAR